MKALYLRFICRSMNKPNEIVCSSQISPSHIPPTCNLPGITGCKRVMAIAPSARHPCPVPLNPKKARQIMFGFVMVLMLVLMTVAPPFAVVARAKAKSSRR